jgi:putative ABC transport system permease protein
MKMHGFKTIVRLSLRDYSYERLLSACTILGLASVLGPLLVLFGVKNGIINTMVDRLVQDPRNLEISPVGSGRYDQDWFAAAAKRSGVAFIIPQTRSIAANMILYHSIKGKPRTLAVDLIPTGSGDPLIEKFGKVAAENNGIVLSASVARKLKVTTGQQIVGRVGRSVQGRKEQVTVDLKIISILPIEAYPRDAAFVRLTLLEATEDYRDGFSSQTFGWPGKSRPSRPKEYPSFRLYAQSIYDVAALRDWLTAQELEIYTRVEEIEVIQNLDRSFSLIFRLIAFVAVCGYFASMASNILANVNRKSRHLGITRLIGFSTGSIMWYPVVQSITTAVLGTALAASLYFASQITINSMFAQYLAEGEYVCRLSPAHLMLALILTILLSILAAGFAAFRVAKIEPSKVIRDV